MASREPVFNAPAVVLGVLAVLAALHVLRVLLPDDSAVRMLLALAFIPARYGHADALPGGELAAFTSPVTHMLIHGDATHLFINCAWLLAFGVVLAKRLGSLRFLTFSLFGGLAGVALFWAVNPTLAAPLVGASGAVAAMMGGVMRFLFNAIDHGQGYLLRENPAAIPSASIVQSLSDKRILLSSAVFIGINLLAAGGVNLLASSGDAIAWEAHLGGYAFGLLAFGLFDTAAHNESSFANGPD